MRLYLYSLVDVLCPGLILGTKKERTYPRLPFQVGGVYAVDKSLGLMRWSVDEDVLLSVIGKHGLTILRNLSRNNFVLVV